MEYSHAPHQGPSLLTLYWHSHHSYPPLFYPPCPALFFFHSSLFDQLPRLPLRSFSRGPYVNLLTENFGSSDRIGRDRSSSSVTPWWVVSCTRLFAVHSLSFLPTLVLSFFSFLFFPPSFFVLVGCFSLQPWKPWVGEVVVPAESPPVAFTSFYRVGPAG